MLLCIEPIFAYLIRNLIRNCVVNTILVISIRNV